ncbi:MAG: CBS domain-containing protein [Chloroflexota bacterium]|nr:CBS domain-containing protein [Chloroflexota bacterium]
MPKHPRAHVTTFLNLFQNGLPFITYDDWKKRTAAQPDSSETIEPQTTALIEQLIRHEIALTQLEATLLALGVYQATAAFTADRTSARDFQAAAWLLQHGAALDTIRRFVDLPQRSQPSHQSGAQVVELMSYGVQTVRARDRIGGIIGQLRRIGHEGYPVVEDGQLVGLLTRRDADRAVEHNLGHLLVADVMQTGKHALTPADSVETLEQTMLKSGWGQIPVVSADEALIGIVTRTDLIKHWAQTHPRTDTAAPQVTREDVERIFGEGAALLSDIITREASERGLSVYMVGGCVRDLLLQRRNLDIDFVVEGDAIAFADAIRTTYGGSMSGYRPFGTATWTPDLEALHLSGADGIPDHIDFATARNEFYDHPTALPTIYSGSIKLDLLRRDFTINTLAMQVGPTYGRIIDLYGGLNDLKQRQLRVLHSLSFIDDPTRILRAARFEQRLSFQLEVRTESLIQPALPMLGRITGERVRNELNLVLREAQPEAILLRLMTRGALQAIHPAFRFDEGHAALFQKAQDAAASHPDLAFSFPELYWHLLAVRMTTGEIDALCLRLLFPRGLHDTMLQTARLTYMIEQLMQPDLRPSAVTTMLDEYDAQALLAHSIASDNPTVQTHLRNTLRHYRQTTPVTDGHTLKSMGLKPGPCFKRILDRLRAARLDGEIATEADETALTSRLISEGICDDHVR